MRNIDLSGVDPLRRAEVLRRIRIIEEYEMLDRPSSEQTDDFAKRMGVDRPNFYRVAKAWRLHRNPAILPGAGSRGERRLRQNGVSDEAKAVVTDVLNRRNCTSSQREIYQAVVADCRAANIVPPSRGATWVYVMEARSAGTHQLGEDRRLIVGRCWAQLPTFGNGKILLPQMALALLLPERLIVGVDISCDNNLPANPASPFADAMRYLEHRGERQTKLKIEMDAGDYAACIPNLAEQKINEGTRVISTTSPILIAALGEDIGGVRTIYRHGAASVSRLLRSAKNSPLSCNDAKIEIRSAVERHNGKIEKAIAMRTVQPFTFVTDSC